MTHTRRQALVAIAASSGAALMPRALLAQSPNLLPGAEVCALTPTVTEGPYYLDPGLVRRDITEGCPGVPTLLRLQVVDATCIPIREARVDVWHCDAKGIYSSFGGSDENATSETGETFLRGIQFTDERGIVEFDAIYSGWYQGRTTHIHFKVILEDRDVLTGQISFPDTLSEFLYVNAPDYVRDETRDTLNADDGIAAQATRASYAAITEGEARYLAQMVVGVDPAASVAEKGMPGAEGRPAGGQPPQEREGRVGPGQALQSDTRINKLLPGGEV